MISENTVFYDLLKMVYIHSAKNEVQKTELKQFKTFAFLFWDSLILDSLLAMTKMQNKTVYVYPIFDI